MADYTFDDNEDDYSTPRTSAPTASGLTSVYEQFRSDLSKPADIKPSFVYHVKSRGGMGVRFDTNLPVEKLNKWRFLASKRGKSALMESYELSMLVIAGQAKCFVTASGEDVVDDHGDYVSFHSKEVQDSLKAIDNRQAIATFFGSDGEVMAAGNKITQESGWDSDGNEIDDEFGDGDPLD